MPTGLILLTAMPLTTGHEDLIKFSFDFLCQNKFDYTEDFLYVLLSVRSFEPDVSNRIKALQDFCEGYNLNCNYNMIKLIIHRDDNAPQNENESNSKEEFWNYWKDVYWNAFHYRVDYVFASENYGIKLAKVLNAEFIPYDINRTLNTTKATNIRKDIYDLDNWNKISPHMRKYLQKRYTIFGAESVGKTTISNKFKMSKECTVLHEYARPYLETVGTKLTNSKMYNIMMGQYSIQNNTYKNSDRPVVIQDTDLLSTIGYYKILGMKIPEIMFELMAETVSNRYFVLSSNIPFEKDPLRYGGDVRQSDDKFWIDLLEEFNCKYTYVVSNNNSIRYNFIQSIIRDDLNKKSKEYSDFVRT